MMVSVVSKDGFTVTVKLAVPTFPSSSVPVQVTVVVPMGNVAPYFHQLLGSSRSVCVSVYVGSGDAEQVVFVDDHVAFTPSVYTPK